MKKCRTIDGLLRSVANGEQASMKVYGSMGRDTVNAVVEGATVYLNRGEGRYIACSYANYLKVKKHLVVVGC